MKPTDVAELIGLAALWGASFLFMRLGAGEFGPVVLSAVRVVGAALLLMPLLAWRGQVRDLRRHWRPILVVGLTNSALPFLCFSYALLSISAGLSAIFNAASRLRPGDAVLTAEFGRRVFVCVAVRAAGRVEGDRDNLRRRKGA